jgi:hypothetical protein
VTPYAERAHLVRALTHLFPAVLSSSDASEPDWPVIYLATPAGQLSWHLAADDLHLFAHVPLVPVTDARAQWDGHTTPEKYRRLREVMADAQLVWPAPSPGAGGDT